MNTPRPASAPRPPDVEVSIQAAAVLLSLAMRDTEDPVTDLAQALKRMSHAVVAMRREVSKAAGSPGEPHPLESELSVCIQSLQFHDRLIQQLAAVRNFLASLGSHDALDLEGFGAQRWDEMLRILRERLSADQHHQLFDLLMRTGQVDSTLRSEDIAEEGSVELF